MYNFVGELGSSPYIELNDLESLGYDVVLFPLLSTMATITGVYDHLERFERDPLDGCADWTTPSSRV